MRHIILPGLTTLTDWQGKIKEIEKLKLKEVAMFLTGLDHKKRLMLYKKLEKTGLKRIPHIHLRSDMKESEISYLIKMYKTKFFNIHPRPRFLPFLKFKKYKNKLFVENLREIDDNFYKFLNQTAGLCIDFSHWEDFGALQHNKGYEKFPQIAEHYKIGCCHISAVNKNSKNSNKNDERTYSNHFFKSLKEFDYLKKYKKYFPKYISLELENTLEEQLEVKKYIEKKIIEA